MTLVKQFLCDTRGVTAIEYALIATLISIAVIGGVRAIGTSLQNQYYGPISSNLS